MNTYERNIDRKLFKPSKTTVKLILSYSFSLTRTGNNFPGFGLSSMGSGLASLEQETSSGIFNQIGLPSSLKAFTALQPGSSGSMPATAGAETRLFQSALATAAGKLGPAGLSSGSKTMEDGDSGIDNITKQMRLQQDRRTMSATCGVSNDLHQQSLQIREAGSGSSSPSVASTSSARNSMYRASSVDSQLALLRNEMVRRLCAYLVKNI